MDKRSIYLDHNATTPLHPEVKQEMIRSFELYGNPSSLHSPGRSSRKAVEKARERIAGFIGADKSSEIYFTSCGSEANNAVMNILYRHSLESKGERSALLTSDIEHPCIKETSGFLSEKGIDIRNCGVDADARIDTRDFEEKLDRNLFLVSVMTANNETGTIQDIDYISRKTHENGALFHTDAVQAFGKVPFSVHNPEIDYATFSAHKIYGPKGVGALYIRSGSPSYPFIHGGHQENGLRAGTENIIGIMGFAKAVEMREREMEAEAQRLNEIKRAFKRELSSGIENIKFNGDQENSVPGTLNISFRGAEGEALLLYLDFEGIHASTGSACASGSLDPSHVLLATGLGPELAHGSVRLSMGRETTHQDMEYTAESLIKIVKKIRSMSTVY